MEPIIRLETPDDYRQVEELQRRAFWNMSVPGCDEHYLAHILRAHEDFIPELDYVAELDGRAVGNVMYSKSKLIDQNGNAKDIVTFGPIGVEPAYQRKGISRLLLERSFETARNMGYGAVVIFGNPDNYVARGFKSCKRYNVCMDGDVFPAALLVKELTPGFLDGTRYYFHESTVFDIDGDAAREFDKSFEYMEKKVLPSQEEFYIHSHSVMR